MQYLCEWVSEGVDEWVNEWSMSYFIILAMFSGFPQKDGGRPWGGNNSYTVNVFCVKIWNGTPKNTFICRERSDSTLLFACNECQSKIVFSAVVID
jgi:hypothetical protein